MMFLKLAILILAVSSALVYAADGQAQDDLFPFTVTIHLDKAEYLLDEPIWLDVFIVNTGDHLETVYPPALDVGLFKLILTDSAGDTLTPSSMIMFPDRSPDVEVPPGDTVYGLLNLLESYGDPRPWLSAIKTLQAGIYTVQSIHYNRYESNRLSFKVVEPTGFDAEAHKLLMEGFEKQYTPPIDREVTEYETLISKYPRSVYAPTACSRLSYIYRHRFPDPGKVLEIRTKILMDYPTSGYADYALGVYIAHHGDSARPFIDSLKTASGSIRFRMLAKQYGF